MEKYGVLITLDLVHKISFNAGKVCFPLAFAKILSLRSKRKSPLSMSCIDFSIMSAPISDRMPLFPPIFMGRIERIGWHPSTCSQRSPVTTDCNRDIYISFF